MVFLHSIVTWSCLSSISEDVLLGLWLWQSTIESQGKSVAEGLLGEDKEDFADKANPYSNQEEIRNEGDKGFTH